MDLSSQSILNFWFGALESPEYGQFRSLWFKGTPDIDQFIYSEYKELYEKAKAGFLDDWNDTPEHMLSLILLLDQFPRNMFRHTSQAFATDDQARSLSREAIALGYDQQLPVFMRLFIYLPFEHSEDLKDQALSVSLFEKLGNKNLLQYALEHQKIIKEFGRFPHRNKILNRLSTPAEVAYLTEHKGF